MQLRTAALPTPDLRTNTRIHLIIWMVVIVPGRRVDRRCRRTPGTECATGPQRRGWNFSLAWESIITRSGGHDSVWQQELSRSARTEINMCLRQTSEPPRFIDRIYRVRYRGETRIDAAALTPLASVIEEEVKNRKKVQRSRYDTTSGSVSCQRNPKEGGTRRRENKKPMSCSRTRVFWMSSQPSSLARSFDWSIGERQDLSGVYR